MNAAAHRISAALTLATAGAALAQTDEDRLPHAAAGCVGGYCLGTHQVRGDLHARWKVPVGLKPVDRRLAEPGKLENLRKPQQADWSRVRRAAHLLTKIGSRSQSVIPRRSRNIGVHNRIHPSCVVPVV